MPPIECPGSSARNWRPEDAREVPCPSCGETVEIWPDDPPGQCPHCKGALPAGDAETPRADAGS